MGAQANCNTTTKVPENSAFPPSSNVEEVCKPGNGNAIMMVTTGIHTPKDHALTCVHVVHQDNTLDIVGDLVNG